MHSQFVGSQYAGYHSIILEIDRQIRFFFHSNSFVFQPSLSPEKTLNKNKKSPMSSLTNLNKWSNYRLNFHRKTYHVTQIFSTQKKTRKKFGSKNLNWQWTRSLAKQNVTLFQKSIHVHDIDFNVHFQVLRGKVANWAHKTKSSDRAPMISI